MSWVCRLSFSEDLESSWSVTLPKPDYSAVPPPPKKKMHRACIIAVPIIWLNSQLNRFYCEVVFSTWPISSKVINATVSYTSSENLFLAMVGMHLSSVKFPIKVISATFCSPNLTSESLFRNIINKACDHSLAMMTNCLIFMKPVATRSEGEMFCCG